MRTYRTALVPLVVLASAIAHADFTEDFNGGASDADTGWWNLTTQTNRLREIRPDGGASGSAGDGYLYNEASTAIPGWSTASPDYQPGFNDEHKQHSPFVDDYYSAGVTSLSADLLILPSSTGAWTGDRAVTLYLRQMDSTGDTLAFEASKTILFPTEDEPVGWNHFDFDIDATSATAPDGWVFQDIDGNPATDWAAFTKNIDEVTIGFYQPGYFYPSFGMWNMGIDNITLHTQAVPEPASLTALMLGGLAVLRRRRA